MITLDMLRHAAAVLEANQLLPPSDPVVFVPRWAIREVARALGAPIVPFPRRRGARGRKRAVSRNWRPLFHYGDKFNGVTFLK